MTGEPRRAQPGKSIQWIDLSCERRSIVRPSTMRGRKGAHTRPTNKCEDGVAGRPKAAMGFRRSFSERSSPKGASVCLIGRTTPGDFQPLPFIG